MSSTGFGVMQRAQLRAKGENPDVLIMTATPIPRTLSLTLYGDLDVSVIDELPAGRKPITTVVKYEDEKEGVYAFVREQVAPGRQAYFVYPLIEESEKLELKAATVHFEHLQSGSFRTSVWGCCTAGWRGRRRKRSCGGSRTVSSISWWRRR